MRIMYEGLPSTMFSTSPENFVYLVDRMLLSNYTIEELHNYIIIGDLKIDPRTSQYVIKGLGRVNIRETREYLLLLDYYGDRKALDLFKLLKKNGMRIDFFSNYNILLKDFDDYTSVRIRQGTNIIETTGDKLETVLQNYVPKGQNRVHEIYDYTKETYEYKKINGLFLTKIDSGLYGMFFTSNPVILSFMPTPPIEFEAFSEINTYKDLKLTLDLEKIDDHTYYSRTCDVVISRVFVGFKIHYDAYKDLILPKLPEEIAETGKAYSTTGVSFISKYPVPYKIVDNFDEDAFIIDSFGRPLMQTGWSILDVPLAYLVKAVVM